MQLSLILLLFCGFVHASETSTLNSSVRALGMGDAFTAVADDDSSLFYNPAGLARVRGLNMKFFSVDAGVNNLSQYQNFTALKSASTGSNFGNSLSGLYGQHAFAGAGVESMFTMPMFGIGVYDHLGATIQVNNPVYPAMHARLLNDYGYVMGVGVPLSPFLHVGADVKYIKRTGVDQDFGPSSLADMNPNNIESQVTPWGIGYGADLGVTAILPAPFFSAAFSAAWKNIGKIEFKSPSNSPIPDEDNDVVLGTALNFDLPLVTITPAVDYTYLTDTQLQMTRKVNFGVEIALPIISLRGGFHEGYYTAGVGMNMGLFRVDAATYGVELGDYPGQIEDRRYVLQFTMKLGIGNFSADGSDKKGGQNGSSGSDSSDGSIWGGRRLKQRR